MEITYPRTLGFLVIPEQPRDEHDDYQNGSQHHVVGIYRFLKRILYGDCYDAKTGADPHQQRETLEKIPQEHDDLGGFPRWGEGIGAVAIVYPLRLGFCQASLGVRVKPGA